VTWTCPVQEFIPEITKVLTATKPRKRQSAFVGEEIHAVDAILARGLLLVRAEERVELLDHLRVTEACLLDYLEILCNLQSAGNSSSPEIDIVARVLREVALHDDVGELQATAGLHHAEQLGKHRFLVRGEIDHAV